MALSMPVVSAPEMTCPGAPTSTTEASPEIAKEAPHLNPERGYGSCSQGPCVGLCADVSFKARPCLSLKAGLSTLQRLEGLQVAHNLAPLCCFQDPVVFKMVS